VFASCVTETDTVDIFLLWDTEIRRNVAIRHAIPELFHGETAIDPKPRSPDIACRFLVNTFVNGGTQLFPAVRVWHLRSILIFNDSNLLLIGSHNGIITRVDKKAPSRISLTSCKLEKKNSQQQRKQRHHWMCIDIFRLLTPFMGPSTY
jgi:hypothetical protein